MAGDNQIAPGPRVRFGAHPRPLMWVGAAFVIMALVLVPTLGVDRFTVTLLTEAFIFGIWAMSLDLLLGYTGLVSFGHAAAFGLGTYVAGYFAREVTADFAATLVFTIVAVAVAACVVNIVLVRASGIAFAILTLVVSQVFFQIAVAWREVTDGMDGLIGVPAPTLLGFEVVDTQDFYWLTLAILVIMYLLLRWLVNTPFGRTLHAIRTSETRAAGIGIDIRRHKWYVNVISWAVAGVAGTLLVFMKAGTTPLALHWLESGTVLIVTIFGGIGTLIGPVIGAVAFTFLRDELTTHFETWQLLFGFTFVLAVVFLPSGLIGLVSWIAKRIWLRNS